MKTIEDRDFKKFYSILTYMAKKLRKILNREDSKDTSEYFELLSGEVSLLAVGAFEICEVNIPDNKDWEAVKVQKEAWDGLNIEDFIQFFPDDESRKIIKGKGGTQKIMIASATLLHSLNDMVKEFGKISKKSMKDIETVRRLMAVFIYGVGKVQNDLEIIMNSSTSAVTAWEAIPTYSFVYE